MSNHPILISKNDLTKWRFDQGIHASSGEPQQTPSPGAHSPQRIRDRNNSCTHPNLCKAVTWI